MIKLLCFYYHDAYGKTDVDKTNNRIIKLPAKITFEAKLRFYFNHAFVSLMYFGTSTFFRLPQLNASYNNDIVIRNAIFTCNKLLGGFQPHLMCIELQVACMETSLHCSIASGLNRVSLLNFM